MLTDKGSNSCSRHFLHDWLPKILSNQSESPQKVSTNQSNDNDQSLAKNTIAISNPIIHPG